MECWNIGMMEERTIADRYLLATIFHRQSSIVHCLFLLTALLSLIIFFRVLES